MVDHENHGPARTGAKRPWVAMLVENEPYPADVRVRNEAQTLASAGYRVTVVAPRQPGEARSERIGEIEVIRFWLPETKQNTLGFLAEYSVAHLQLIQLTLRLLIRGVNIVHVSNPPDTLAVLLVIARLFGRRAIFDNHDLFPELFRFRYGKTRLVRALRVLQRLAFRSADVVITTNQSQRETVLSAVRRDPATVLVVRNGPRAMQVDAEPKLRSRPITEDAPLQLLFVGALEPQDGIVVLAEVLALLTDRHRLPVQLTVVGEGSCRGELLAEARRRSVGNLISFTGRIPHGQVGDHLREADVCLDPAPCSDLNHASTMVKIAEYMAAGKPIVAFDLRETRHTAGDAALYAPCGDIARFAGQIAALARDANLAKGLVSEARARLPQLMWESSAESLLRAYALLEG